jgi:DNA-binding MarR family transcriptional regulator
MPPPANESVRLEDVTRLRLGLLRLARRLRQQSGPDITPSQLSVLSTLDRHGPLSHGDLAAHERIQPPTVTRIVTVMEEAGLVQRSTDPDDRRCSLVEITRDGRRRLEKIRSDRDAWLAQRLGELSPEQRRVLHQAVPVLERLIDLGDAG